MKTPTDAIRDALEPMTVFNTKDQAALAVIEGLRAAGFRIVTIEGDEPYIPNEYTVRLSYEEWRRINMGIK